MRPVPFPHNGDIADIVRPAAADPIQSAGTETSFNPCLI